MKLKGALILAIGLLLATSFAFPPSFAVIQGHRPLVIQGHSPINFLVTSPNGVTAGCSLTQSGDVPANQAQEVIVSGCGTGHELVKFFGNSPTGVWTVQWEGFATGPYTISGYTCVTNSGTSDSMTQNSHAPLSCPTKHGDPLENTTLATGNTAPGETGSLSFNLAANGQITTMGGGDAPSFVSDSLR
jgi:hypothetical protein